MSPGLEVRLARLRVPGSDVVLSVPMDHGVSLGPIPGIVDLPRTIADVADGGASCLVLHKGNARFVPPVADRVGFCLHVSASTASAPDGNDKVLVATVEEAVALGADAVSTHTNFGAATESRQLQDLGQITTTAHRHGLPVLAMAYPRGPDVDDPMAPERVMGAARAAAEVGADLVKTVYTGDVDSFREVVRGTPVPVLVAGGARMDDDLAMLRLVADAREAGAKGVSIGRNVFAHPQPGRLVAAIRAILVERETPEEAARHLGLTA